MRYSDDKLQTLISYTLRSGVLAASALGILGGIVFFASHPQMSDFRSFRGTAMPYVSPVQIFQQAFGMQQEAQRLRGLSIAQIGIMLLLATPVIRVIFSIFGFAAEKDRAYVLITCIVLVTLTASICLH
jgi:uncharacterized membrane protein